MIVSFDLDDTLFINPQTCEAERRLAFPLHLLFHDRLRKGTVSLFRNLETVVMQAVEKVCRIGPA